MALLCELDWRRARLSGKSTLCCVPDVATRSEMDDSARCGVVVVGVEEVEVQRLGVS